MHNIQLPLCRFPKPERCKSEIESGFDELGAVTNMVDVTPQETSFSEKLSSTNRVYLQNATGIKACWCKYNEWPDELMSATL